MSAMRGLWLRSVLAGAVVAAVLLGSVSVVSAHANRQSGAHGSGAAPTAADVASMTEVLGVVSASGGSFNGKRLALTGVQPQVTWFSDRPAREAGLLPVSGLSEAFFARQVPPNAAVVIEGAPASRDVVVVELSKPRYDAKSHQLSFAAKQVATDRVFAAVHPRLARFADRADAKIPARFAMSAVFVDTAPAVTETHDQALVAQLSDQYGAITHTWSAEEWRFRNCTKWVDTNPEGYHSILNLFDDEFNSWLDLAANLQGLQQAVADGGTLDAAQQQLVAQMQAAEPTYQDKANQFLPVLNAMTEQGFCVTPPAS
jgi:hypothetical protein